MVKMKLIEFSELKDTCVCRVAPWSSLAGDFYWCRPGGIENQHKCCEKRCPVWSKLRDLTQIKKETGK